MTFIEADSPSDLFEVGVKAYLPREYQLKDNEMIGADNPNDKEVESDLEDNDEDEIEESERQQFLVEVGHTIERCLTNKFPVSNAIMEMKSLKMSFNMNNAECIEAVLSPLLDTVREENAVQRAKVVQKLMTEWKVLLNEFVKGEPEEREEIQFSLIRAIEIYCATHALFQRSFHVLMQVFFSLDLLSNTLIV